MTNLKFNEAKSNVLWTYLNFEDALCEVKYTSKVQRKNFKDFGTYPIISQESELINGYWDLECDLFRIENPLVIFGDHTKVIKYVDFNFVLGADGVKILNPISKINAKFLAYFLMSCQIPDLGYARHYRLLKEISVPAPPLTEQKRIVAILDQVFADIEQVRANTEQNLKNARELFESYLYLAFRQQVDDWVMTTLADSCEFSNGKAHENDIDENGDYIVVNSRFISQDGRVIKRTAKPLHPLDKNDIAMVMSDVPGGKAFAKCFIVPERNLYSLNQRICSIKSKVFDVDFLYFQLNRNPYLMAFDNKGSQANLRKSEILACPLSLPSMREQRSIAEKLRQVLTWTKSLEAGYIEKLRQLDALKKSILQKAFSGELAEDDSMATT